MRRNFFLYVICTSITLLLHTNVLYAQKNSDTTQQQFLLYKDSADWKIGMMLLNTTEQEFSPVIFRNGLFFCTNAAAGGHARHDVNWNGMGLTHVLYIPNIYKMPEIDFSKHQYSDIAVKANRTLDELHKTFFKKTFSGFSVNYHYGPLCFSADGQKVFFTRTQKMSTLMFEICEATVTADGKFENIKQLPFNSKNFNCYHPAIAKDGNRLYFVSDQPGGVGKADIYYAERFGDTWSANPLNMGAPVNTAGNEMFPFIDNDTLYYSSDGMPNGLGGMDIYAFVLKQKINATPKNLGFPVNSSKNDFGITKNKDGNNFFSSNRNGNDDIFKFSYNPVYFKVKGKTVNAINKEPVARISLQQLWTDNEPEIIQDSLHPDADGNYLFKIKPNHNYKLVATGENIYPDTLFLNTENTKKDIVRGDWLLRVKIDSAALLLAQKKNADSLKALTGKGFAESDVKDNRLKGIPYFTAYFNYNSAQLLTSGFTALDNLANKLKQHTQQNVGVIINGYTDNNGSDEFNKTLSKRRAQSIAGYLKVKDIPDSLIHVQYFGKENPVVRNGKIIGWMSRRVEVELTAPFKPIQSYPFIIKKADDYKEGISSVNADSMVYTIIFDYKSDKISSDAFAILDKLVEQRLADTAIASFVSVKFIGCSDYTENNNEDFTLAKRRVDVVLQYLRSRNLNVVQPRISYRDKLQPQLVNGQSFSWMNRKVEIIVNKKQ